MLEVRPIIFKKYLFYELIEICYGFMKIKFNYI